MHSFMATDVHRHTYVYIDVCMQAYVYTYLRKYIHAYVYVCIHIYSHAQREGERKTGMHRYRSSNNIKTCKPASMTRHLVHAQRRCKCNDLVARTIIPIIINTYSRHSTAALRYRQSSQHNFQLHGSSASTLPSTGTNQCMCDTDLHVLICFCISLVTVRG